MKFARVCLSGSWLAFGRRTLGVTEMLLPVFPSHAHLQESRRPCRVWVEDQSTRGRFLFSYKCGKEWCSQRISMSTDRWKSTAKNQDNVIWIVSLGLREYRRLRRICSELLPMVRQLVQEVNWHEATIEDKGPSIDDILSFHPVALKWDKQGVCIFCYEPGSQTKLQVANVVPEVNEGTLEFVWSVKGGLRIQERRQVVVDLSQAIGLMKKIRNKSLDKPIGEGLLWKSVTQLQVDLPPQRHPHVGDILEQLLPGEGLERNLEGLSKMLATMKGGSFPSHGDAESNLVPTTVWLDHGVLKPLVYQMADYQRASDERIYSRALQALLRLLKAGGVAASADFIKAVMLAISGEGLTHIGVYRILAAVLHRPEVKQAAMDMRMPDALMTELQRYCILMISRKANSSNGMITTGSGRYSARTTAVGGLGGLPPTGPLPPHLLPNEGQYSLMERIWGVQPHMSTDQHLLHLHSSVLEILLGLSPLEVPDAEPASENFKQTLVKHLLLLGPSKYSFNWRQSVRTYDLAIACVHEYASGAPQGMSFEDCQGFRLFLPRSKAGLDAPAEQDLLVGYIGPEILELVEMRTLDVTVQRGLYERLRLIVDYVWSSPSPILAQQLLETLTKPLVELCGMLLKGATSRNGDWPITLLQLFYLILSLFTALSKRVADKTAQDEFLKAISGADDFMELLWQYSYHTLTCDRVREALGDCEVETMCLGVWRFLTSVAELCKDQGADEDADAVVLTLTGQLAFALEPECGLVMRILGMVHWVDEDQFRDDLCVQVLAFLEAFFSIPNNLVAEAPDLITQELELNFRAFQGHCAASAGDLRCMQCRVCAASLSVMQSILGMHLEGVYLFTMHLRVGEHLIQEIVPQGTDVDPGPSACFMDSHPPFASKGMPHGVQGGLVSLPHDPLSSHPVFEVEDLSSTSEEGVSVREEACSEASWASPALGAQAPRSRSPGKGGWACSRATTTTSSVMSLDSVEFEGRCMDALRPNFVPKLDLSNVAPGSDGYYTPLSEDDYESTILEEDDPSAHEAAVAAAECANRGESDSSGEDEELALVPCAAGGQASGSGHGQAVGDSPLRPVSQLDSDAPPLTLMPIPECRQMVDWDKFDGLASGRPPSNFEFTGDCSEDARRWEEWDPRSEQTSSEYDLTEFSEGCSLVSGPGPGGASQDRKRPVVPPMALDIVCRSQEVVHHPMGTGPGPGPSSTQKGKIIWKHKDLHVGVLRVLLEVVLLEFETVGRQHGGESVLVRQLCVALHQHLNGLHNKGLLLELRDWAVLRGPKHIRLVRLLMKELFDERSYESLGRIGRGQFAQVHRCSQPLEGGPATCAVKVMDLPEDAQAMRSLRDIYKEIEVLEGLAVHPCVSELYDYGVVEDTIFVVMKEYKCDLLNWRKRISSPPPPKLCLKVFLQVAKAVEKVHQSGVAHFDLKCSNVLLEPLPGLSEDKFWSPQVDEPAFRVVLGDFGEAMRIGDDHETTLRSRGTEWMKSPEMLLVGKGTHGGESVTPPTYPSDVWALGCLLFELQSGKPLFDDSDWSKFFIRVTDNKRPLIPQEKLGMLPRGAQRIVATLLSFVLIRDPRLRPPLAAVIAWVQNMLAGNAPAPPGAYKHPPPRGVSPAPDPDPSPPPSGSTTSAALATFRRGARNALAFVPLTETVLLCSRRALEDPWALLHRRVSHILYVSAPGGSDDLAVVRGAACRADVPLVTVDKAGGVGEEGWAGRLGSVLRMVRRGHRLAVVSGEGAGWSAHMERVGVTLLAEELGWPRMKCRLSVRAVMVQ